MDERYISSALPPTPWEREVTEIIIEECAEIQKRGTKLLRFGPKEIQPGHSFDNTYRLGLEVGDLLETLEMAVTEGLIPMEAIERGRHDKRGQLKCYMQTDPPSSVKTQEEPMPSNLPPGCSSDDGGIDRALEAALETLCDQIDNVETAAALIEMIPAVKAVYALGLEDGHADERMEKSDLEGFSAGAGAN